MTPAELVAATGMKLNNLNQLLYSMAKAGEIQKGGRGKYVHLDRTDLLTQASPHKNDNKIRNPQPSDTNIMETLDVSTGDHFIETPSPVKYQKTAVTMKTNDGGRELPEIPEFLRREPQ